MATAAPAPKAVLLRGDDNVAVAARPIPKGTRRWRSDGRTVEVREPIALGHKVALRDIAAGEPVRKYGQIIGFASQADPGRARGSTSTTSRPTCSSATTPSPPSGPPVPPPDRAADVPGLPPPRRPGRHAELHRRHQHGELLGQHLAVHRRPVPRRRLAGASSRTSTASSRSPTRGAAACRSRGPTTRSSSACWPGSPTIRTSRPT